MDDILRDLSPAALSAAIEANLYCLLPAWGKWPKADVHEEAGMTWCITDLPYALFNGIVRTRLLPETTGRAIKEALARCRTRGVPASWWTGPSTEPADLGSRLMKSGFNEERMPGMAIELAKLKEEPRSSARLTIQIVRDEVSAREWGIACARGFGEPTVERLGETWADLLAYVDPATVVAYLGYLDGQPVATSMLMYGAGVAGIYAVATVPEARRKGIGAAMTRTPLLDARSNGYAIGILQASEMGASVYRSLGFQEYCEVFEYIWRPSPR